MPRTTFPLPNLQRCGSGLLLSAALLLSSCNPAATVTAPESEPASEVETNSVSRSELAQAIEVAIAETTVPDGPGVAVLVLEDGEILHSQGYGLSDVENEVPITSDMVFDLASVSKQMTALALLILVEEDEIALDDPVTDYLPDFDDPDPDNPILVTDLLYHISGLADYTGDEWEGTEEEFANLSLEDHLEWLNEQDIHGDRGVEFEYNNSGYALLALIVQRVSGQPFHEFMQERIFEPLGMENTVVFHRLGQTIPYQAKGYLVTKRGKVEPSSLPSVIAGDGNVFSSLNDLARYDKALRNEELISADLLDLAFTPGELDDGSTDADYGFGWEIAEGRVEHSGGWYGTSTYYRHYTDAPVTVIVLSNDENYDPEELADKISNFLDL